MQVEITEALKKHPGAYDIYVLLCSGWTAHRTASFVTRRHGVYTSPAHVAEFSATIPSTQFISISTLVGAVQDMDVVYNVPGEMVEMLFLIRRRIEALTLVDTVAAVSSKELVSMIKLYFLLMEKYLKAMDVLGFIPDAKRKRPLPLPPTNGDDIPTLEEVLDGRASPEPIQALSAPALHSG